MEKSDKRRTDDCGSTWTYWRWAVGIGCLAVVLLGILIPRGEQSRARQTESTNEATRVRPSHAENSSNKGIRIHRTQGVETATAEEIVAAKLSQFSRNRRDVLRGMAKRYGLDIPSEAQRFFDAAEAGRWDEMQTLFQSLKNLRQEGGHDGLATLWGPILETYGVAESTHLWPAQKLLDYGNAILDSLRPGMVYVGGTDPGRFIPTLLNETSDGEHHIVLTQNAMADNSYLKYVDFLYGGNFATLKDGDSQSAFQQFMADAQKRLKHDEEFPDEPKQIRPGEDVRMTDNRIQVSGQVAVMEINELLLHDFMDKNPDATFALEESFPLKSFYSNSIPLGPIMELGVSDAQTRFTLERATQVVDYWRDVAQQLMADPETPEGSDPRKTYSKMVSSQAHLLEDRKFTADAEQAYRLAVQLEPSSPEAAYGLANLLTANGKSDEARGIIESFQQRYPTPQGYGQGALWNAKGK
jgi:hypothetical protein